MRKQLLLNVFKWKNTAKHLKDTIQFSILMEVIHGKSLNLTLSCTKVILKRKYISDYFINIFSRSKDQMNFTKITTRYNGPAERQTNISFLILVKLKQEEKQMSKINKKLTRIIKNQNQSIIGSKNTVAKQYMKNIIVCTLSIYRRKVLSK